MGTHRRFIASGKVVVQDTLGLRKARDRRSLEILYGLSKPSLDRWRIGGWWCQLGEIATATTEYSEAGSQNR